MPATRGAASCFAAIADWATHDDATVTSTGIMSAMRFALAIALTIGMILVPAPAHAGPIRGEATSTHDGSAAKTVTATCPAGKVAFGVGGRINDDSGSVVLTAVFADAALSSVTAAGHARPGYTGSWSVTAIAVCRYPGQLNPVRIVAADRSGTAVAGCPSGTILYSSGFELLNADGTEFVDQVVPSADLVELTVHSSAPGTVLAIGVCAVPIDMAVRTEATVGPDSKSPKLGTAPRPVVYYDYGSWMFGAGAAITGTAGAFLTGLGPASALDAAKARAVTTSGQLATAGDDEWELTVYGTYIGSWY